MPDVKPAAPEKREPCRFMMFTVLWRVIAIERKQKPEWWQRGDKFEKEEPAKMLQDLLRMIENHGSDWITVVLYDMTIPKWERGPEGKPLRWIVKIQRGVVEINRLKNYSEMLTDFVIPNFLNQ